MMIGCKVNRQEPCEDPNILGACSNKNTGIYYVIKGQKSSHLGTSREEILHNAEIYKFKKLKKPARTPSGHSYTEDTILLERETEVRIKIYE